MGKQELDAFLRDAGATTPNPFSAEQVFSAVANDAAWERIVHELAFIVSPAAIAQVRRALSGMGSTKKKRLDPQLVAASKAHELACRNAGVSAPFLRDGRPVDSSGKEVTPYSMDMLNQGGALCQAHTQRQGLQRQGQGQGQQGQARGAARRRGGQGRYEGAPRVQAQVRAGMGLPTGH